MVVFKDQIRGEESNKITDRESPCDCGNIGAIKGTEHVNEER